MLPLHLLLLALPYVLWTWDFPLQHQGILPPLENALFTSSSKWHILKRCFVVLISRLMKYLLLLLCQADHCSFLGPAHSTGSTSETHGSPRNTFDALDPPGLWSITSWYCFWCCFYLFRFLKSSFSPSLSLLCPISPPYPTLPLPSFLSLWLQCICLNSMA